MLLATQNSPVIEVEAAKADGDLPRSWAALIQGFKGRDAVEFPRAALVVARLAGEEVTALQIPAVEIETRGHIAARGAVDVGLHVFALKRGRAIDAGNFPPPTHQVVGGCDGAGADHAGHNVGFGTGVEGDVGGIRVLEIVTPETEMQDAALAVIGGVGQAAAGLPVLVALVPPPRVSVGAPDAAGETPVVAVEVPRNTDLAVADIANEGAVAVLRSMKLMKRELVMFSSIIGIL